MSVNMLRCVRVSIILLIGLAIHQGNCAKILMSSMYGEGSHFLAGAAIGEALVDRGHDVTYLISRAYQRRSTDPKFANFSYEIFDHKHLSVEEVRDFFSELNTLAFKDSSNEILNLNLFLTNTMAEDCENLLLDTEMMGRLAKFDALVLDPSWPCVTLIKAKLDGINEKRSRTITTVSILPLSPNMFQLYVHGSPYNPAYQPEMITGYSNKMTFLQRTANVLQSLMFYAMATTINMPVYNKVAQNVGIDQQKVSIWSLYKLFDLHLLSADFAAEFPIPLSPNIIPVGGLTASPPARLEEDLEEFMRSAGEHGVIVFTLGTYLASVTKIRPEFAAKFAEAFRKLPQKVIWQLKDLPDYELPPNVRAMSWVPQNDLLGHPQTRLFLYQGGNNGFQEACYHGVPTVVVPLHGDQYSVAARVQARGMGRRIDKRELSAELIYDTLHDVLNDPKYLVTAKHVSAIMQNNPMSPRDRAAFWIDHVIKHGGHHLIPTWMELSFIQLNMLDVMAFTAVVFVVALSIIIVTMKYCLSFVLRSITGKKKAKQN